MINTGPDGEQLKKTLNKGGEREHQNTGCYRNCLHFIQSSFMIVKELVRWLLSVIPRWTRVQSPGLVKLEGILILQ